MEAPGTAVDRRTRVRQHRGVSLFRNIWLSRWASVARDPMPWRHALAFYLGIPLLLAALNGANHAGLAHSMSVSLGVVYWVGLCVPLWLAFDAMTRAVAVVLRPWALSLWIVLFVGALASLMAVPPYVDWYVAHVAPALGAAPVDFQAVRLLTVGVSNLDRLIGMVIWPLLWISVNYYYDRMLSIPRYRGRIMELEPSGAATPAQIQTAFGKEPGPQPHRQPLEPAVPPSDQPAQVPTNVEPIVSSAVADPRTQAGILTQLPAKLGTDVVALQAEDHYVRVYTVLGSCLVRYRFKDAVQEVQALRGRRVHRSFWVRDRYVERASAAGDLLELVLSTGLRVPVSRAYRTAARAIAEHGPQPAT